MNEKNIIIGLDIGTTKVCTIVGAKRLDSEIEIIGIGSHPSYGLKKGSVVNIDNTINSIQSSLEEARLMAGVNFSKVTIGIAGSHIYSFNSSGVVAIRGNEITQEDIDRVLEAAQAVVIPSDRKILHVIPQEFRVDNTAGIKNPIGMRGVRLEAHVHVVTGSISLIQNLIKCVEQSGVVAENIVLQPIASSEAVLSPEEKELGVVIVDIGGGTTDIAVWKNSCLIHSQIIPVGGNLFTNDLATALKIPHAEAERIKIHHGSVLSEKLNQSSHITVQGMSGSRPREVSLSLIAEVLGARAEELYTLIKNNINDAGLSDEIAGGYILTGGGAMIQGMMELGEYMLHRSVKIGYPIPFGGMTNIMQNPKYSTVLGLLIQASKNKNHYSEISDQQSVENIAHGDVIKRLGESLKSAFKEIF